MSTPAPAPQQAHVLPRPFLQSWEVQQVTAPNGQQIVKVLHYGVNGHWVTFLDAADAKALAAGIEEVASRAATGLIFPSAPANPGGG